MTGVCMEYPTTGPTAMDVYKDSILVDSVVVFKEKE